MARLSLSSEAVLAAVREFNRLGREGFLRTYGFGPSREFYLYLEGRHYDSKAICGVAYGYEHPSEGPLTAGEFSGGEQTVQASLEQAGFTVVKGMPQELLSPLVLVENETTAGGEYDFWADQTGVQYQYPNSYHNRIQPGRPFIYYRGIRRRDGKRGPAEYFGMGTIGAVWMDPDQPDDTPKINRRWFCEILDYRLFATPVAANLGYERFSTNMGWRTGVRTISWATYRAILMESGITRTAEEPGIPGKVIPSLAATSMIWVDDANKLFVKRERNTGGEGSGAGGFRRSKQAIEVGTRAEELVYRWLRDTLPAGIRDTVDWVAQRGETPGWDIQYIDEVGRVVAVEVKATSLSQMLSVEITANEWNAAQVQREHYRLAIVTHAMTDSPRIALLNDPFGLSMAGELNVTPTGWRLVNEGPQQ